MTEKKPEDSKRTVQDRKRTSGWSSLTNIVTVVVAVAAIGLSVWEGREYRRHNRLSVMPHLKSIESVVRNGAEDYSYTIKYALDNSGLGPAVLKRIIVFKDDDRVYDSNSTLEHFDFNGFLSELDKLPFSVGSFTSGRRTGEFLRAGREHLFFSLSVPFIDTLSQWTPGVVLDEVINRHSFVFCYCSIYDESCNSVWLGDDPPTELVCRNR